MTLTLTIEIPALDRLCGLLEARGVREAAALARAEIDRRLPDPPAREAEVVPLDDAAMARLARIAAESPAEALARIAAESPAEAPVSVPAPAPAEEPPTPPEPAPGPAPAATEPEAAVPIESAPGMDAIRRACAQLRDRGQLTAIQGVLKEFGVRNLSALTPEQLPAFAGALRGLGAEL